MTADATIAPQRQAFYRRIDPLHLAPLWEAFDELITPEPRSPCLPHLWAYGQVRPYLMECGALISAEEAERRVLILENPALRGQACVTHTLFAGLQLVLPGETAPCHRHAQSALRLVLEGSGAYTSVNGERVYMERGDFIVTGAWSWHDHCNDTRDPVIWLDGLDLPLVKFLDASFIERHPGPEPPRGRPAGDNVARFGSNMLPVGEGAAGAASARTLLFSYPYARSREALEQMRRTEQWHPHHGLKMAFINPADGGPPMATISTFLQLLPKGFETAPYRSTDGAVYAVIEGAGETALRDSGEGERVLSWQANDVFVVPSWHRHRHRAREDSVLFSFSDRTVQEKLGLWREQAE